MRRRLPAAEALVLGICVFAGASVRAQTPERPLDIEVVLTGADLDRDADSWLDGRLGARKSFGRGRSLQASLATARRFGSAAHELVAGGAHGIGSRVTAAFETGAASGGGFLPKWKVAAEANVRLGRGFVAGATLAHREYRPRSVRLATATFEKYAGDYRVAYTFWSARLQGSTARASHSAAASRAYGERSMIGLVASFGNGVEASDSNRLIEIRSRGLALHGVHALSRRQALIYGGAFHRLEGVYDRFELTLGLRRTF